jgi:hypothetical protein
MPSAQQPLRRPVGYADLSAGAAGGRREVCGKVGICPGAVMMDAVLSGCERGRVLIKVLKSLVVGPLEPYAVSFAAEQERKGYTTATAENLAGPSGEPEPVDGCGGDTAGRPDCGCRVALCVCLDASYASYRSVHALEPLLGYLRGLGAAPVVRPPRATGASSGRWWGRARRSSATQIVASRDASVPAAREEGRGLWVPMESPPTMTRWPGSGASLPVPGPDPHWPAASPFGREVALSGGRSVGSEEAGSGHRPGVGDVLSNGTEPAAFAFACACGRDCFDKAAQGLVGIRASEAIAFVLPRHGAGDSGGDGIGGAVVGWVLADGAV